MTSKFIEIQVWQIQEEHDHFEEERLERPIFRTA